MEEEDKSLLILTLFSYSYENLVTTLLFKIDTLILEDVTTSFLTNEVRRQNLEKCQDFGLIGQVENYKGMLYIRESRSNRSMFKSKGKGKVQCFHYKKYDHIKRDCPERVDMKKIDNPSTTLADEQEYIGDVFTVSKNMNTFFLMMSVS